MALLPFLHTQHPAVPLGDDAIFDNAALVFTIEQQFAAPVSAVWDAFDNDHAWKWLPFPGVGVHYDSAARGVGVVREMGSVFAPWRFGWVERERFWRYEPDKRITFGVVSGNWSQYLAVRHYAEDMTFDELPDGGTKVRWTVAVTPRLPLRFATWFPPVWKVAYHVGLGNSFRRHMRKFEPTAAPVTRIVRANGKAAPTETVPGDAR
ncbi:SRPBCC family protein [Nocardia sp. NBC_00511]|uniref:SRPBCC family protein n=1 Tax=Nocardia sp. NBC_00511 TaxID=2903591 RepID=UPI0030E56935